MLGRLVGKALIENWMLEVDFAKSFLKIILGKPLTIEDLEDIDHDEYNGLKCLLEDEKAAEIMCLSHS